MATKTKISKAKANKDRIKRLRRERKNLEERLEELRKKLIHLEEKRRTLQNDLEDAREYGDSFENQDIENINLELQQVDNNIIRISQEIENLELEISKLDREIAAVSKGKSIDEDKKGDIEATLNSYFKDFFSRVLLDGEFKVTYPKEIEEELGVKELKVRFVLSDEHISLEEKDKAISISSPLGKAIMKSLQTIFKENFKANFLEQLAQNLGKYLWQPDEDGEKERKAKKTSKKKRKESPKELPPTLKVMSEKIVDTTFLSLNKTPNDFIEMIKRTFEKLDIRSLANFKESDDNKIKNAIRDAVKQALIKAIEDFKVDRFTAEVDLPELGEVEVKVKTVKR